MKQALPLSTSVLIGLGMVSYQWSVDKRIHPQLTTKNGRLTTDN